VANIENTAAFLCERREAALGPDDLFAALAVRAIDLKPLLASSELMSNHAA